VGSVDRRAALRAGAVAAAGAAGLVLGGAQPAAAANGDSLTLGSATNAATNPTALNVSGGKRDYGLRVSDVGYTGFYRNSAIFANAQRNTFDAAIAARAFGTASGMFVDCDSGSAALIENSGSASTLRSINRGSGPAAEFWGPVRMRSSGPQPPSRSSSAQAGDLVVDSGRILWMCVANGTPGTWRRISGPAAAGAFHPLTTPIRVYDSRPGTQPAVGSKTPLAANVARPIDCSANGSGVPAGAIGVLATLLVVNTTKATGNLTLWANGIPVPATNNVLWTNAGDRASVLTYTGLDAAARCQVRANQTTDVVLDVVGYYR
jgi:hypothetical protein